VSARAEFLTTLRAGLRGAPAKSTEEIIADYTAHFDEGAAASRGDAEIAAALGDPLVLADELRMELRIETFEAAPSTRSGARLVAGVIAMRALNTTLVCLAGPLLALIVLTVILAIFTSAGTGVWLLFAGSSLDLPGGVGTAVLCGLGLIAAAVSLAALLALAAKALISGLARHTRLHYQLLPRVPPRN
jgi:uncharacterized membrane protein